MIYHDKNICIAIVDDHALFRRAISDLICKMENCKVVLEAATGKQLLEELNKSAPPDIIFLDLNMPDMNGFETAEQLQKNYPSIPVLMLTMYDTEQSMMRLIEYGVKGFLKKDGHPSEIKNAIQSVITNGYYYSYNSAGKLASLLRCEDKEAVYFRNMLSPTELRFLMLACSELTYKEIASVMGVTPRGVDSIRDSLFTKLDVKTRVGMAMYAFKNGIYL